MKSAAKAIINILKLAVGIGIIVFLLYKMRDMDWAEIRHEVAGNWPWIVLGMVLFGGCLLCCMWRWSVLVAAQGIEAKFSRLCGVFFIGHFFNSFLMGATGGDLVKAVYVTKETSDKKTEAVATVFIDRFMGLIVLMILAVAAMLTRMDIYWDYTVIGDAGDALHPTRPILWFMILLLIATLGVLVLSFAQNIFEKWKILRLLIEKLAVVGRVLHRVYDAFYLYRQQPAVLVKALGVSLLNHLIFVLMVASLARGLGIELSYFTLLATIPAINVLGSLPITPGGLGIREAAYVLVLGTVGVPDGKAFMLSLLYYVTTLIWSMVGAVVFILFSSASGHSMREEMRDLRHAGESQADNDL